MGQGRGRYTYFASEVTHFPPNVLPRARPVVYERQLKRKQLFQLKGNLPKRVSHPKNIYAFVYSKS